jgi:hypothetical protein
VQDEAQLLAATAANVPSFFKRPDLPRKLLTKTRTMRYHHCLLLLGASLTVAHEYMHMPPARTDECLLNGVIMGSTICQTLAAGDDQQCLQDPLMYVAPPPPCAC